MPINYGQYQLSNSRQVKPFAGSALPELTSVAGVLQDRFDKAMEQEDMLSRAVRSSQAAPFAQDQQLLGQLKQEFKNRINERSKKGDYENMYRDTMLDARNFMDRYQPIVENAKKYQDYKASLNEAVQKGVIKDPDKARRLLALSTQSYQGMSYDPVTGTVSNQFSGATPVKDIDPTEKIDKWMKDIAPTILKKEVKYTDGTWMKYSDNKWTVLTPKEIDSVMSAGARLDPEFGAWMTQEKQLAGVDVGNLTPDIVNQMKDGPIKQAILTDMATNGTSPTQAARKVVSTLHEQNIYDNMKMYANKFIRNDRETGSGITGADPYNLERYRKKLTDEDMVLSMPILQPENRMEISGAEDLLGKVQEAGTAVQAAGQNFHNWVTTNKLKPTGNGQWIDDQGNDKTLKYLEQKQVYDQAQKAWQNLQTLDAEAAKRTGYNPKNVSPSLIKKADEVGKLAANKLEGQVSESSGGFSSLSAADKQKAYQTAKGEYLRVHAPGYAQYDQMLKDMTQKGAQLVNVQTFNSKSANDQATSLFKSLVLNLDASGVNAGTQGLKWASGEAAGDDLSADDYKKVVANATFAGYGMDTDGQLKYYYKVGSVKQNAKGKTVGEEALVKMPALPGTTEILLKHKQTDLAQLNLGQRLNETINTPSGQGYIDVDGKNKIFVDRIDKAEIGSQEVGSGINLRFPRANGTYTEVRAGSIGEAISLITSALQNKLQREGHK